MPPLESFFTQIREQMSGPDLHGWFFSCFQVIKKSLFYIKKRQYATFQCGRCSVFKKITKKLPSKVAHDQLRPFYFTVQSSPAQTTVHSPELIFHIMKSRDQTSVLLSVFFQQQKFLKDLQSSPLSYFPTTYSPTVLFL